LRLNPFWRRVRSMDARFGTGAKPSVPTVHALTVVLLRIRLHGSRDAAHSSGRLGRTPWLAVPVTLTAR